MLLVCPKCCQDSGTFTAAGWPGDTQLTCPACEYQATLDEFQSGDMCSRCGEHVIHAEIVDHASGGGHCGCERCARAIIKEQIPELKAALASATFPDLEGSDQ